MAKGRQGFSLRVVAILAAIAMACASLLGFMPVTRQGVFCPTAPVQTVVKVERDCCGRIKLEKRAPKPGEREFVQCRCAEKKSANHTALVASKIVLFLESGAATVNAPIPVWAAPVMSRSAMDLSELSSPPDVHPPSA